MVVEEKKKRLYKIFFMFGFNFVNNKIAMIKKKTKKTNSYTEENHILLYLNIF